MWVLVTNHIVVGIEHFITLDFSDVRIVHSIVQAVPDVDQRVRVPQITEDDKLSDIKSNAPGRSGAVQYTYKTRHEDFTYC